MAFQIPDNLSFDQASTIPLGLATAAIGLYQKKKERGGLELVAPWVESGRGRYARQAIFISGGAGSVGQYGTLLSSACQASCLICHHCKLFS
jgi:NADPH:quinone reductase-like Zn-dependent oxidoreductase